MLFSRIKGHTEVLSSFQNLILDNKFKGVYLLQGPKGVGKYTIARQASKYLTCTGTKDDFCKCENCRLFPNIPDFLELTDEDDSSIKNKEIEKVEEFLSLYPYRSRNRVLLIDDIERLTYLASNGLLKILEDIKENNIIIAVTSDPQKVLQTLASRTTPIEFRALLPDDCIDILKSKGHLSEKFEDLKRIIPYLSGSILKYYGTYTEYMSYVPKFLKDYLSIDEDDLLIKIKEIDEKQELLFFVEIMIMYMNDILKVHTDGEKVTSNQRDYETINKLKEDWTPDFCFLMLDKLRNALIEYNRGLNIVLKPRILSTLLLVRNVIKGTPKKKKED